MLLPPIAFHFFFFNDTATTEIYTLSLHDALPIFVYPDLCARSIVSNVSVSVPIWFTLTRIELPTDRKSTRLELQSRQYLVCRLLLEKKKKYNDQMKEPDQNQTIDINTYIKKNFK